MSQVVKTTEDIEWEKDRNLIKSLLPKSATEEEVDLFISVCKMRKLDPRLKQIYGAKRKNKDGGYEQMTIEARIDGLRLIADRTGRYSPGREPVFNEVNGKLVSCTSFVKKQTQDKTWHEVAATVYLSEYDQKNHTWNRMPRTMLAKVAESHALRKAFPGELSGIYSEDEMPESPKEEKPTIQETPKEVPLSVEQVSSSSPFVQGLIELDADCRKKEEEKEKRVFPKEPINKAQIAHIDKLLVERGITYKEVKELWSLEDMDRLMKCDLPNLVNAIKSNWQPKAI